MTGYCIKAETKHGKVVTLRRGFDSRHAAEDHPVQLKLWKRVWVERVAEAVPSVQPSLRRSPFERIESVFETILAAAIAGERCPQNGTHGVDSHLCRQLAADGRIKIEVFARNFRVVTILSGPHAGKRTAPPPYRVIQPKLIITASGTQKIKRFGIPGGESALRQRKLTRA